MIGMSQIKKKTIQGIVIGATVGIAVAIGVRYSNSSKCWNRYSCTS